MGGDLARIMFGLEGYRICITPVPCRQHEYSNDLYKTPKKQIQAECYMHTATDPAPGRPLFLDMGRVALLLVLGLLGVGGLGDAPPLQDGVDVGVADGAVAADGGLLGLEVLLRARGRGGVGVPVDEDVVVLAEEAVDVLERAVGRLGVEEVDDGHEREVEDGPDDVEAPVDAGDADGRDLDDEEVDDPVGGRADGRALGPHRQAVDLGRIKPRHTLPADAEEDVVEEEEGDGRLGPLLVGRLPEARVLVVADADRDDGVADELAKRGVWRSGATFVSAEVPRRRGGSPESANLHIIILRRPHRSTLGMPIKLKSR